MKSCQILCFVCFWIFAIPGHSAQLLIDAIASAPTTDTAGKSLPSRSMTKDQVQARFGSPADRIPAVGQPPIERWIYDNFTVYFEGKQVISSVFHRVAR